MEKPPTILIVNGDDFGLSEGINRGILSAFQHGILRSASLMPNGAAFDDAVEIARNTPGLGVGIHISLVDEHCVAPPQQVRGLADGENMLPASHIPFLKAYAMRHFGIKEIRAEIEAQVEKVLKTGLTPTHIDSHQHLHLLPAVLDAVLEIAQKVNIKAIRLPLDSASSPTQTASPIRAISHFGLKLLCRRAIPKLEKAGLHHPDHFWGANLSGNMVESNLLETIACLKPGVNEIMTHPGLTDPQTEARYPWAFHWNEEASALQSESAQKLITHQQIRLANFQTAWPIIPE